MRRMINSLRLGIGLPKSVLSGSPGILLNPKLLSNDGTTRPHCSPCTVVHTRKPEHVHRKQGRSDPHKHRLRKLIRKRVNNTQSALLRTALTSILRVTLRPSARYLAWPTSSPGPFF